MTRPLQGFQYVRVNKKHVYGVRGQTQALDLVMPSPIYQGWLQLQDQTKILGIHILAVKQKDGGIITIKLLMEKYDKDRNSSTAQGILISPQNHATIGADSYKLMVSGYDRMYEGTLTFFDHWVEKYLSMDIATDAFIAVQQVTIASDKQPHFLTVEVCRRNRKTKKVSPSRTVFLRPDSVAALLAVRENKTDKIFVLLVKQERPAVGEVAFVEALAGTMEEHDGQTSICLSREISEEAGITNVSCLRPLGSWYPSCGACNEQIHGYFGVVELYHNQIEKMLSCSHGATAEGECTHVVLLTPAEFLQQIAKNEITDGKALALFGLMCAKYPGSNFVEIAEIMVSEILQNSTAIKKYNLRKDVFSNV